MVAELDARQLLQPVGQRRVSHVEDADVQRHSPLIHDHINLLGRYHFTNPDQDDGGQLRPLRDPRTTDD